ncbi:copper resistance CopC/CopD family protein [Streptomyces beihaiensis]|uniref:Copper resistance protein CopC/CopD n=1 Tax=Streptomyces beihaiensis TaxID=2984495 RepID=A0ABT3TN43_9ACTN|nr:copper resistance protein CopC [Streptomyces beihaiensis]MCX3058478.1 copper resistance protein CopC/CopD [Streptomyces beihaiensis]
MTTAPRLRHLVLLFLAVTGALLAGAAPASAHAALTGSDPEQGAVVQAAPRQVSLTFSEEVAISDGAVRVLDPSGKRVDTTTVTHKGGTTYSVGLGTGLPDGTFTVAYQVVSADSHPVSGAFTFSVGAPSKTAVALPSRSAGGGTVGALYGVARYLAYAGFALLVGGTAFVLACWPRGAGAGPVRRIVATGWVALTGASLAMLLMRGAYTTTGSVGDIFDMALLGQVLQTKAGAALTTRLLLLAAAALFVAVVFGSYVKRIERARDEGGPAQADGGRDAGGRRELTLWLPLGGGLVAVGLAATWAMAEHASTGIQPWLAMPVDVLHLLAVAAWLGGLTTLLVALYRAPGIEGSAVRRFSTVAFSSVAVLAATGLYQSWRQVGSWSALTGTAYGQLLLVKVGLVAVLVGIGWISRTWTRRLAEHPAPARAAVPAGVAAARDEPAGTGDWAAEPTRPEDVTPERATQLARQRAALAAAREKRARDADPQRLGLRRSVLAEACVAVVLLAVTTVLTDTEPGRTAQEVKDGTAASRTQARAEGQTRQRSAPLSLKLPFDTGGAHGKGIVRLTLDPGRTGDNTVHLTVENPGGKPFDIPEVKVALTLPERKIGPLHVVPHRIATGHWSARGVQIPVAGAWKVAVTVRTSDFDEVTVIKTAQIG